MRILLRNQITYIIQSSYLTLFNYIAACNSITLIFSESVIFVIYTSQTFCEALMWSKSREIEYVKITVTKY